MIIPGIEYSQTRGILLDHRNRFPQSPLRVNKARTAARKLPPSSKQTEARCTPYGNPHLLITANGGERRNPYSYHLVNKLNLRRSHAQDPPTSDRRCLYVRHNTIDCRRAQSRLRRPAKAFVSRCDNSNTAICLAPRQTIQD